MVALTKKYTTPIIYKGKDIVSVPKGSTKIKEQAKGNWYIDFSFINPVSGKMQRFRKTHEGNRIKDHSQKAKYFEELCKTYRELLEAGWNPFDEVANTKLKREIISLTLLEAKNLFIEYHKNKGSRRKSIQTYLSKVNAFIDYYGENRSVTEITDYHIITFLNFQEAKYNWVGTTYVNAKINLNNFFRYLTVNKYIASNPVTNTETRKKVKTEAHEVFNEQDFALIMEWLKTHDHYALLFCRTIYYTCIRPKELRYLQLKHIDLENQRIIVPASIAKNKQSIPVRIDPSLMIELQKLDLNNYDQNWFLFGSTASFVNNKAIGENTPYNRFRKCLVALKLTHKNYTLYSFKHMSNVKKFLANWSIAEISKANRHSSIAETETYLKDLLKFVNIDKDIPAI